MHFYEFESKKTALGVQESRFQNLNLILILNQMDRFSMDQFQFLTMCGVRMGQFLQKFPSTSVKFLGADLAWRAPGFPSLLWGYFSSSIPYFPNAPYKKKRAVYLFLICVKLCIDIALKPSKIFKFAEKPNNYRLINLCNAIIDILVPLTALMINKVFVQHQCLSSMPNDLSSTKD